MGSIALAETLPCGGPFLSAWVPRERQEDVPVDVRPALVFLGCPGEEAHVTLVRSDDPLTPVAEVRFSYVDASAVLWLDPYAPLAPYTAYLIEVNTDQSAWQVPFTTGGGSVAALDGAPAAEVVDGVATWLGAAARASLRIDPVPDPYQVSLITVANEFQINVPLYAGAAADTDEVDVVWAGSRPQAQCYTVTQWNGRGVGYATDLPCVDVVGTGCAAVPAARTPVLVLAAAVAAAIRRRRVARGLLVS